MITFIPSVKQTKLQCICRVTGKRRFFCYKWQRIIIGWEFEPDLQCWYIPNLHGHHILILQTVETKNEAIFYLDFGHVLKFADAVELQKERIDHHPCTCEEILSYVKMYEKVKVNYITRKCL
jgi:hypothetical protein